MCKEACAGPATNWRSRRREGAIFIHFYIDLRIDIDIDMCVEMYAEKVRWGESLEQLKQDFTCVTGNVIIASAAVSYLGAFTSPYRNDVLAQWVGMVQKEGIPCSDKFELSKVLGDPVKIREWNICGANYCQSRHCCRSCRCCHYCCRCCHRRLSSCAAIVVAICAI